MKKFFQGFAEESSQGRKRMFKLRYLPLAEKDLEVIVDYIVDTLKAPQAAYDFLDAVEAKINRIREHPYSCRVFQPSEPIDSEYRVLIVNNYLVFYLVSDDTVEVHRVVYGKRDLSRIIK